MVQRDAEAGSLELAAARLTETGAAVDMVVCEGKPEPHERAWFCTEPVAAPTPAQDRDRQSGGGALRAALGSLDGVLGCIQAMRGRAPQDADTAKIYLRKAIQEIEAAAHPAPVARADGDALRAEVLEEAAQVCDGLSGELEPGMDMSRLRLAIAAARIRALATRTNKEHTNG